MIAVGLIALAPLEFVVPAQVHHDRALQCPGELNREFRAQRDGAALEVAEDRRIVRVTRQLLVPVAHDAECEMVRQVLDPREPELHLRAGAAVRVPVVAVEREAEHGRELATALEIAMVQAPPTSKAQRFLPTLAIRSTS